MLQLVYCFCFCIVGLFLRVTFQNGGYHYKPM